MGPLVLPALKIDILTASQDSPSLEKAVAKRWRRGDTSSHPCILPHLHAEVSLTHVTDGTKGGLPRLGRRDAPLVDPLKLKPQQPNSPHYYCPSSVYLHHSSSLAHDTTDDTMAPKTPPPGSPPATERASKTPEQAGSSPTAQRASRSPEQRSPGAAAPGDLLPGDHRTEAPPVWHGSGVAQSY